MVLTVTAGAAIHLVAGGVGDLRPSQGRRTVTHNGSGRFVGYRGFTVRVERGDFPVIGGRGERAARRVGDGGEVSRRIQIRQGDTTLDRPRHASNGIPGGEPYRPVP